MSVQSKWRVIINGLEFAQHAAPNQKRYWHGAVRGLGKGDIRTTSFVNSGAHGGYVGDQFLGLREIPMDLFVYSQSLTEVETLAREFNDKTPIGEVVDLRFITPRNKTYFVRGAKIIENEPKITDVQNLIDYQLTLLSGDPVFYDISGGDYEEVGLFKEIVGGIDWASDGIDWDSDGIDWDSGQPNATATNTGAVEAYPTILIDGKITNPVFRNATTGREISLNIATGVNNMIVLDHINRTAVLDGTTNLYNNLVSDDFWSLSKGNNEIVYTSGSSADTATVLLRWNNGFTEIF